MRIDFSKYGGALGAYGIEVVFAPLSPPLMTYQNSVENELAKGLLEMKFTAFVGLIFVHLA